MKVINVLTIQKQYHSLHEAAYLLISAKDHPLDKGDEGSWEETDLEAGIYSFILAHSRKLRDSRLGKNKNRRIYTENWRALGTSLRKIWKTCW